MTIFYSASTGGFYDSDIHGDAVPSDAVVVTAEDYAALFQAQSQGATIKPDANGSPTAVIPPAPSLDATKAALCAQVDSTADQVYVAIGGPSPGRLAEYEQANKDASAYKDAGYSGSVPDTVQCWATASDITPKASADSIIATATQWNTALTSIRSARLLGKRDVNAASSIEAAQAAADASMANILAVASSA